MIYAPNYVVATKKEEKEKEEKEKEKKEKKVKMGSGSVPELTPKMCTREMRFFSKKQKNKK
jgi:hypothetical protein